METTIMGYIGIKGHMGGCQNYGPFLGNLNFRCRIIIGIQRGTIILTTTHIRRPKDHTIKGFWAILSLRVTLCTDPRNGFRYYLLGLGFGVILGK